jgi:hypothetical protein
VSLHRSLDCIDDILALPKVMDYTILDDVFIANLVPWEEAIKSYAKVIPLVLL